MSGTEPPGTWRIDKGAVLITSPKGSDKIFLPINTEGTLGVDGSGAPITVIRNSGYVSPPVPINLSALDPAVQQSVSTLMSFRWNFTGFHPNGDRYTFERYFYPNGTYWSGRVIGDDVYVHRAQFDGTWKVAGNRIELDRIKSFKGPEFINLPITTPELQGINEEGVATKAKSGEQVGSGTSSPPPSLATSLPTAAPVAPPSPAATPAIAAGPIQVQQAGVPFDLQQRVAAIIRTYSDSIISVNGHAASGGAFIATMDGTRVLLTNARVTAGIRDAPFKNLGGAVVQGDTPGLALGEDIFCMTMPPGGNPLQIMIGTDANAAVGDAVMVPASPGGSGIVTPLVGKIVAIGPDVIDIDAPLDSNSIGSPIIHLKSGKVIGVAAYTVTNQDQGAGSTSPKQPPIIRRFGYRIDGVKSWQPVNWRTFGLQADQLDNITTMTNDLHDLFSDLSQNGGRVTPGRDANSLLKSRIDGWAESKSQNPSPADAAAADVNFLNFLKSACQADIAAAQHQPMYDYFQRQLIDQKKARDQIQQGFEQMFQSHGE